MAPRPTRPTRPAASRQRFAPTRFLIFLALFAVAGGGATALLKPGEAVMAGFDLAAIVFLGSLRPLFDDEAGQMRQRAKRFDANRIVLLIITSVTMLAILVAVAVELSGDPRPPAIALVIATLAVAWAFSNTVYALHYAHLFYGDSDGRKGDDGGIDFPDTKEPDYWDFVYFAYTLGMTFQTSDVAITGRHVRKIAVFHCLAAFIFNLGVVAFTINVLGG